MPSPTSNHDSAISAGSPTDASHTSSHTSLEQNSATTNVAVIA